MGDGGIELPDVGFGNDNIVGKSAIAIDADDLDVLADVTLAGAALQALAAGDMHLRRDEVALFYAGNLAANGGDMTAELVAGNQRRRNASLRPGIPVVDVQIGTADGGDLHLHKDIGGTDDGNWNLAELDPRFGLALDHGRHQTSTWRFASSEGLGASVQARALAYAEPHILAPRRPHAAQRRGLAAGSETLARV